MANNPLSAPLPADLPENWAYGQTIAPSGTDVGLSQQHGYNYLSEQINAAQKGVNTIGNAFTGLVPTSTTVNNKALTSDITLTAADVGALPVSGGTMRGTLFFNGGSGTNKAALAGNEQSVNLYHYRTPSGSGVYNQATLRMTKNESEGAGLYLDVYNNSATGSTYRIYGEHYKPTAFDVGAAACISFPSGIYNKTYYLGTLQANNPDTFSLIGGYLGSNGSESQYMLQGYYDSRSPQNAFINLYTLNPRYMSNSYISTFQITDANKLYVTFGNYHNDENLVVLQKRGFSVAVPQQVDAVDGTVVATSKVIFNCPAVSTAAPTAALANNEQYQVYSA